MAVVDSLLRLLASQGADALVIPSGEPPSLERGGEPRPLSMPDPGPEFVAMVVQEVTDADARAELSRGAVVESSYVAGDGARYGVRIEPRPSGPRVVIRTASAEAVSSSPAVATTASSGGARPSPQPIAAAPSDRVVVPIRPPAEPIAAPPRDEPGLVEQSVTLVDPKELRAILERAIYERASDVLLSNGMNARLRIGGQIVEIPDAPCTDAMLLAFAEPVLHERARRELARTGSTDFAIEIDQIQPRPRYRANLFRQHGGLALALRPISREAPTLSELNLPPEFATLVHPRSGLVLVTGTAGSGKSTTLVALIEHINATAAKHVITIEDPIEYEYVPKRSLVHQRQVGTHVDAFSTGLRAALRESPDIILLGEMRDHATISAALTAAETGHLVLSTLHANGVAMAIDRMIDVFPQHQQAQVRLQLSGVLRAIVTQRLLPSTRPPARVPAVELLRVNIAVAAKIRDGRGHQLQSEVQKGRGEGMIPFEASLAELVRRGLTPMEEAVAAADDPVLMRQILQSGR